MDGRAKNRIQFLMNGRESHEIQAKLKLYQGHYKSRRIKDKDVHGLYEEFLTGWAGGYGADGYGAGGHGADGLGAGEYNADTHNTDKNNSGPWEHMHRVKSRKYDLYDIAALALIHYRVTQMKPNEEFGLVFLDEAQDFGLGAYYVLRQILPDTYFTIMGDVSQNINYDTGLNDWRGLRQLFLTGPKDKFLLLEKSYRNTIEISEYAGKILEQASFGRYKVTPVIRHGLPVGEEHFFSDLEMAERIAQVIDAIRQKGYSTTAVICRDDKEAAYVRKILSGYTPLADGEKSNFSAGTMVLSVRLVKGLEFDTVVLWNPDMKKGAGSPETAKPLYVAATRALHELYVFTM
jgi:DNA helicase-2/ATP-dependent DNA helicase PcrA